VYGGGGITPDLFVAPETLDASEAEGASRLFPRFGRFSIALFDFAVEYVQRHPDLAAGFTVSDAELDALYAALPTYDATVERADFDRARRFVRYHLEREIALQAWGEVGQFRQSILYDRQLLRALEILEGVETPAELLQRVADAEPDSGF
jgi:hypothetical protein